jgi:hypothetical protein
LQAVGDDGYRSEVDAGVSTALPGVISRLPTSACLVGDDSDACLAIGEQQCDEPGNEVRRCCS